MYWVVYNIGTWTWTKYKNTQFINGWSPYWYQRHWTVRTWGKLNLELFRYLSVKGQCHHNHGPINHGLATPFLSYRVTLNARKTRDFIQGLNIWQSYKLGPLRKCSDTDYRRSTEWLYLAIRTAYALRMLGKLLFVIVLPISGSGRSMVYRSVS